ncbi:TRAP transporter permease [Salinibacillus xinjiangensis]|uniref:TRAP transporter fused permease subunit n=1 Tax=Salinibacillus xinjiangensis TaxID=1229268 RepID=A0A6G1X1M6_9BACI|nr:TRAP transporter permease [Salinibacillus xinjiangensis]MRG84897.1 TRAP transporter fused permease subunit [Salinibacillus xinjiangensis]
MTSNQGSVENEKVNLDEANKYSTEAKMRSYNGPMKYVIIGLSIFMALFLMYYNSIGTMESIILRAWTLGFLLILSFLLFPASKRSRGERKLPTLWDFICIILSLVSIYYFIDIYETFARDWGGRHRSNWNFIFGGIAIALLFEASRRVVGYALTILSAIFLLYVYYGSYIPGIFGHGGFEVERIIDQMFWGSAGVYGIALGVFTTFVFMFVLFGAFLKNSGFTDFINDLALTVAGRTAGGPAKVSVIGSGFMGMVNGSAVGNTVTTGAVTIPLMKKTGYKSHFAGAVEATASTGGQFAPPVMGAAGFVMAEFIGVPYSTVMLAALIPALLYFLTVFMAVHFEAKRTGLKGISKENIPNGLKVLKEGGHLLIPIAVLVYLLVDGTTPTYAAVFSLFATVIVSWFRKSTRMGWRKILLSIEEGVKASIAVGVATAIVGIIVGAVTLTSLGLVIGQNILDFAGESLLIAGFFTMIISIIMGMGIPATASYIIVATVSAPLLVELGASLIVAHMFAFFYAALSNITPPVALASYAAAGLAGASPNKVSLTAVRLGITGFIIPYFFLFNPVLLFDGVHYMDSLIAMITAIIGVIALASGLQGWLYNKSTFIQRILMTAAGLALITPGLLLDFIGIGAIIVVYFWQKVKPVNNKTDQDVGSVI